MLKTKLLSLKHRPSEETLSEHFLKFDKIIRELEGTDCIVDNTDKVCHLYLSMSAEYELTVTALRTLPEKDQKLAMVMNRLLEEETKRMTVRRISSWYGQDQDRRCTGLNEERCCLYWAAIGPVRLGGRDATRALS
jgi:hypothetical protein